MSRRTLVLFFFSALYVASCTCQPPVPASDERSVPAATQNSDRDRRFANILEALRASASPAWWPGFDVLSIPIAVFDGETTYLVAHPSPPAGFEPRGDWHAYSGRHPAVVANNAVEIGGVLTAGILLDRSPKATALSAAALIAHEAFHVYQRQHHPDWSANEAVAIALRHDDIESLAERVLETRALKRAVAATEPDERRRWIRAALESRAQRFAIIGADASEYERKSELNEGLAQYIQWQAEGGGDAPALPNDGFEAADVRSRSYAAGAAWAILLDSEVPEWKRELTEPLDVRLRRAMGPNQDDPFAADERANARAIAVSKANAHRTRLKAERQRFVDRAGAHVIVEATAQQPMQTAGFDPLNVLRLGPKEVLHTRFLKLMNDRLRVEILNHPARTIGIGSHPLFSGVQRLELRGMVGLEISSDADVTTIQGEGIRIEARNAEVTVEGSTTRIALRPQR